jgi:undecaprenyl-diphosphatase
MLETLEAWDRKLFLFLNGLHADWLDPIMFWMSDELVWIPVYLLFLWMIGRAYDWKVAGWALLAVAVVVTIGDRSSVELFKEVFERYRPSRNLEIADQVHTVNGYRGGQYGFVSSHATNFFGVGTFLYLLLKPVYPRFAPIILLWAGLIAYTRIYLGVHYPGDIIGGGLLGALVGFLVFLLFRRWVLAKR